MAPPPGPPAVRMVPVLPLLLFLWLFTGQGERAVGVLVDSETGRHPMVVSTVPVGGGTSGESGWSRGRSGDSG